jgi:excisionase family DNA binding protein
MFTGSGGVLPVSGETEVVGISEAAALLGAHEQTVRKLARRGEIPAFKVGADWRFRREALIRWTEGQNVAVTGSVLIVDDEEKVCELLVRLVERAGYRARSCLNSLHGLALIDDDPPDVVLLDLQMPVLNGAQFLELLRERHPALPVVIVTGYPDGDLMQRASQHAPVGLLGKPVEAALLERTLEMVLGQSRAHASSRVGW